MQRARTVSIDMVHATFAAAMARGLDSGTLSTLFDLPEGVLEDPTSRIDRRMARRIWTELPALTSDRNFGLTVAKTATRGIVISVIGHLQRSAPTLGAGLDALLQHQRILQDTCKISRIDLDDTVEFTLQANDSSVPVPRHATEFVLGRTLLVARRATGTNVVPVSVAFQHERPADDSAARELFGCELTYGAPINRVVLNRTDLDLPQRTADPHLAALIDQRAQELAAGLDARAPFLERVKRVVADELSNGTPTLGLVAKQVRASPRTTQRRLAEEGTSLGELIDQVRRDLAMRYMEDHDLEIQEIAFRLGFSDASGFGRWFMRCFGQRPRAYRRRRT